MAKRILLTGGAGFIGSHIADRFLADGWKVRALDCLDPQVHGPDQCRPEYLDPRVELIVGDICDRDLVKEAIQDVDIVSHHAANVGVGQSMYEIERYSRTNALGCGVLLDVVANETHTIKKLMVASSMSIYGEGLYQSASGKQITNAVRPLERLQAHRWEVPDPETGEDLMPLATPETKPIEPSSVYAIHKRDHEELVRVVGRAYGIPTVAFRYFNVYGTRQALSNPYTGVVAIFCSRLLNGNAPLVFEDGEQRRDFVSVLDVAEANFAAAISDKGDGEVFNVGSGRSVNVIEIAEIVADALGKNIEPEITGKFREGDIRHCFADITKIREKLGWSPEGDLAREMPTLAEWVQTQQAEDTVEQARKVLEARGLAR